MTNDLGKFLSLILRHKPEEIGITLDKNGYANVNLLIEKMTKYGKNIDLVTLEELVITDEKNRYSFNETKTMVRANQGHSISLKILMKECRPPKCLLHGTSVSSAKKILEAGISKMERQYVHLTDDRLTAIAVGERRGNAIILEVATEQMYLDGFIFYLSDNNVWQTEKVPSKYCRVIN
ncbi:MULTISPECIES: RNA 2'-phosphotransferase [Shouchella]|uniref:Probable RNA 2'-phosphotransferase n=1 Tax=Shouchella hunanensis TaxID=766894 RepID=A0ABY7WD44_9BACI|nr:MULTISPECIES: RNA 2'-phosphotransferase [Shouchella]WDF05549.1 RNA 2'-phosphotransferase [Shouchella hunanensis]